MKKQLLDQIIKNKENKSEFAIITNIANGESCIFEKNKPIDKNFEKHLEQIKKYFEKKKNGVIENTDIFVETYIRPIKVIIVGAVHIAQYLVDYAKSLNFEIVSGIGINDKITINRVYTIANNLKFILSSNFRI